MDGHGWEVLATGSFYPCLALAVTPLPNPPFRGAGRGGGRNVPPPPPALQRAPWPQLHLSPSERRDDRPQPGVGPGTPDPRRHAFLPRSPLASRAAGLCKETENRGARGAQIPLLGFGIAGALHPGLHLGPRRREARLSLPTACRSALEETHSVRATAASPQRS